jgi:hypothetical protein
VLGVRERKAPVPPWPETTGQGKGYPLWLKATPRQRDGHQLQTSPAMFAAVLSTGGERPRARVSGFAPGAIPTRARDYWTLSDLGISEVQSHPGSSLDAVSGLSVAV